MISQAYIYIFTLVNTTSMLLYCSMGQYYISVGMCSFVTSKSSQKCELIWTHLLRITRQPFVVGRSPVAL